MDPRIGLICRDGISVYYAFLDGPDKPPLEGTLEEVESALGLHPAEQKNVPAKQLLREFIVTVTPSMRVYAGPAALDQYQKSVWACSHAQAIRATREERREIEGRHAVSATYRAQLAPDSRVRP